MAAEAKSRLVIEASDLGLLYTGSKITVIIPEISPSLPSLIFTEDSFLFDQLNHWKAFHFDIGQLADILLLGTHESDGVSARPSMTDQ